ncbi:MAG: adenosine kinase [Bacteroidales bacterium]|nr:adenosine kinase [Bacteroidales bacterium]
MEKILGIGNALVDVIIPLKDENLLKEFSLPKGSMQLVDKSLAEKIELSTTGLDITLASGGSAANTIHGLAKLGAVTGYIGKTGNDHHGKFFKEDMEKAGIETFITHGSTETGRAIALVTPDSERTFATFLGSAVELENIDLSEHILRKFTMMHVEGYLVFNQGLAEEIFKQAKKAGLKISLDLASYNVVDANLMFLKEMTEKYVDILFANEEEARSFTGKEPEEAVKEIAKICDLAVVKTGKSGSMIRKGPEEVKINIIKCNPIDTTGAGDLYAAGFLYGLSRGFSLEKCGNTGALLAGKVIEVLGAKIKKDEWKNIHSIVRNMEE